MQQTLLWRIHPSLLAADKKGRDDTIYLLKEPRIVVSGDFCVALVYAYGK